MFSPGQNGESCWEPHLCTVVHPFPHFQCRYITDALSGPFRLGDGGRDDAIQHEAEVSEEEEERGGGDPGQDGEAEWVGDRVDELLGEGFGRFVHVVVNVISVG